MSTAVALTAGIRYTQLEKNQSAGNVVLQFVFEQAPQIRSEDHFASYYTQSDFYDKAIADAEPLVKKTAYPSNNKIKGMIVPHHLLVGDRIAQAFDGVSSYKAKTVILIGPDHFGQSHPAVATSDRDWQTPYGILQAQNVKGVSIDHKPFVTEHAINGLTPFVRKYLPRSKIIPVIVRDTATDDQLENAFAALSSIDDALIIGSFDFSHYLPDGVAQFHDDKALAVLASLDEQGTHHLDIDSEPGLRLFFQLMKDKRAQTFYPIAHTSSVQLVGAKDEENTSHITGYYVKGDVQTIEQVTIHAFGDMMLDRYVRSTLDKRGKVYPYEHIRRFMEGADILLANLEGSITDHPTRSIHPNDVSFTFNPQHAAGLKSVGIDVVSLANNHAFDFGVSGYEQTKQNLDKLDIAYFGHPKNTETISTIQNIRGMRIGFVGYHQFGNSNQDKVVEEIYKLKEQADFIAVMPHWGNEYQITKPSAIQQNRAHTFIDAGADVIIGAHPHVVQPIEVYKDKVIFYSLGNFVFDQLFNDDVRTELSVGITVTPETVTYRLFPMENIDLQIHLMGQEKRDILLSNVAKYSIVPETIRESIVSGILIIER